jgi:hypothetical protein
MYCKSTLKFSSGRLLLIFILERASTATNIKQRHSKGYFPPKVSILNSAYSPNLKEIYSGDRAFFLFPSHS